MFTEPSLCLHMHAHVCSFHAYNSEYIPSKGTLSMHLGICIGMFAEPSLWHSHVYFNGHTFERIPKPALYFWHMSRNVL